jgi:hypothetical protein
MKRFLAALLVSMLGGWAVPAGAAAARPHTSTWHRLNPDQTNPAPEHERIRCREGAVWVCRYDKVPEPGLNFTWDRTTAKFVGRDVTGRWACPAWFTECAAVTRVVDGVATIRPEGEPPFKVPIAYVFLKGRVLYLLVPASNQFQVNLYAGLFSPDWLPVEVTAFDAAGRQLAACTLPRCPGG